ncbi:flagellar filament capping protein FliD [Tumebacillus sp. ITR2]|uniref:Flagellar hook-associated protein 2 n=1 Tax=Tumebacillus amylolyticus TaxID=2801339 RepID=A0ABS1J5G2_9BACL|nr:flagellar filament capping protein FliD [Tumebacillus amylolyticus]MBL0385531.1 flagellar filament capping protein FliD [Tumebacillus amylolyticus]
MPTRINGLGTSGLDTDTLVKQLMQAKRIPIDKMVQKKTQLEWKRDAYRDMNTVLSGFQTAVDKLNLQSTLLLKKATSSDETKVSATASSGSINGTYNLVVKQVAKAAQVSSTSTLGISSNVSQSLTATGTSFDLTGELGTQTINIAAGSTIGSTVQQINAVSSQTGVKAVYDQAIDKFTLVSTSTGAASKIQLKENDGQNFLSGTLKLAVTNDPVANPGSIDQTAVVTGQDAIVNLNNGGDNNVRTNNFTLNNITFNIKADPASFGVAQYNVSLSVDTDVDGMYNNIKTFVDKYNEVMDKVGDKLAEPVNRDYLPLTDTQKADMKDADIASWTAKAKSGLLRRDDVLAPALDSFRSLATDSVGTISDPNYSSLSAIGIGGPTVTGMNNFQYTDKHLYIDETKLKAALTADPDSVVKLFTDYSASDYDSKGVMTNSKNEGIASRLSYAVKNALRSVGDRMSTSPSLSPLTKQINDYNTTISEQTSKLSTYEQQYYSQFASLETMLTKMQTQGSWLMSQLGN